MGLDIKAYIVVGVSMAKLFTKIEENVNVHDEHDKFGNKTGKEFKEEKVMATLPNGNVICIAEKKSEFGRGWDYDFNNSMEFDGGEYVGEKDINISINYSNPDVNDLSQMILGISVCETGWMDSSNEKDVEIVDEIATNKAIANVRSELAEQFGYVGDVQMYLINYISY